MKDKSLNYLNELTMSELLDFATIMVNNNSIEKEDDLTQIKRFREVIKRKDKTAIMFKSFIKGWVIGMANNYNVSIKQHIRKIKLEKLEKS